MGLAGGAMAAAVLFALAGTTFGGSIVVAQTQVPTISAANPSPSPADPDAQQQLEIDDLRTELGLMQRELQLVRQEVNADIRDQFWAVKAFGFVLVILGIASAVSFWQKYRSLEGLLVARLESTLTDRVNRELAARLGRIDPTGVTVRVPRTGFDQERAYLDRMGFGNVLDYDDLDESCLSGCVVVPLVPLDNKAEERLKKLGELLQTAPPSKGQVGFVMFAKGRVPDELLPDYPLITYANSVVTLGTNLLTLARLVDSST